MPDFLELPDANTKCTNKISDKKLQQNIIIVDNMLDDQNTKNSNFSENQKASITTNACLYTDSVNTLGGDNIFIILW